MESSHATFNRYDDEFESLIGQIEKSLDADVESDGLSLTNNLLQQCDDLIKQMSLEARSVENSQLKRSLLNQVKDCKNKLKMYREKAEQRDLFGGGGSLGSSAGKERLLQAEEALSRQNDRIENAHKIMMETESVALEITEELGHNREKLMSTHGRIREVSGMAGRAGRVLQSMNQRAVQQKLCMYGMALGAVFAFIFIMFGLH